MDLQVSLGALWTHFEFIQIWFGIQRGTQKPLNGLHKVLKRCILRGLLPRGEE
jgi:hypothetical protein